MEAYATAKRTPARVEPCARPALQAVEIKRRSASHASATPAPGPDPSAALGALLIASVDDETVAAFAARLAPYLSEIVREAASGEHVAYTVASLAAELAVSPKVIRCAISRGELNAVKRGTRWIISGEAVGEWASTADEKPTRRRRRCLSAPKAAGPSLRSVFCEDTGARAHASRRPR
jgi:hypothetical protein